MNLHRRKLEDAIGASIRRQREQGSKKTAFGHYWEVVNGVLVGVHDVVEVSANTLPTEGLNYLLDVGLPGATAKPANAYVGLYQNAINPAAGWTGANVAATAGENTSTTEGYSQTTRPVWTANAASAGAKDNVGQEAVFTIVTATEVLIEGAFLITDNARGGTAGKLYSAARYGATRHLQNADDYRLGFRITLTS